MSAVKKTNAMRILETAGVAFEPLEYAVDPDNLDAMTASAKAGLDPDTVFKTIVMRTDSNEICVFCVPAPREVNLKKARLAAGAKEVLPVKEGELLGLTGYIRGGCSPLGMKRTYRTFIDENAILYDRVSVSGGVRGLQLLLAPQDLARIAGAEFADIATDETL